MSWMCLLGLGRKWFLCSPSHQNFSQRPIPTSSLLPPLYHPFLLMSVSATHGHCFQQGCQPEGLPAQKEICPFTGSPRVFHIVGLLLLLKYSPSVFLQVTHSCPPPPSWAPLQVFPLPSDLQMFGCLRSWPGSYSDPSKTICFYSIAINIMSAWIWPKSNLWARHLYKLQAHISTCLLYSSTFKPTLSKAQPAPYPFFPSQ